MSDTEHAEKAAEKTPGKTPVGMMAGPNGGRLQIGNPGNTGGQPGRSGRKPAAWKARCAKALEDAKALPVLESMIAGDIMEHLGETRDGEPIIGETKNRDRLGAIEFLAKYGHGLPVQPVDVEVRQLLVVRTLDAVDGARDDVPALPAPEEGNA